MTPRIGIMHLNRTHGEHYIYYNTINRAERLEMIYRSIGKQYDWDLEKYRVASCDQEHQQEHR